MSGDNGHLPALPAESALHIDIPETADPADMRLAGLAVAVLGGMAEDRVELRLDPVPIYVRLRRNLMRRGLIDTETVPMWPAVDW